MHLNRSPDSFEQVWKITKACLKNSDMIVHSVLQYWVLIDQSLLFLVIILRILKFCLHKFYIISTVNLKGIKGGWWLYRGNAFCNFFQQCGCHPLLSPLNWALCVVEKTACKTIIAYLNMTTLFGSAAAPTQIWMTWYDFVKDLLDRQILVI